nr:MAG TPA: hypothetical protein [Bacteriophage sp.]
MRSAYRLRTLFRVRCKYNDLLNINAIRLTRYNIKTRHPRTQRERG